MKNFPLHFPTVATLPCKTNTSVNVRVKLWRFCVEKHQTLSLQLCDGQPTVLTLIQSTTRFGRSCKIVCSAARFVTSTSWSCTWSKSENISTRWSSIKRSGSGVHVLELAFDFMHTVDILNTDFRCAEVLPFARTRLTVNHACAYSGHLCFWVTLLNLL